MRRIAERHINETTKPAKEISRAARYAWITGVGSASLYMLLFAYSDLILRMAKATLHGDKGLFFVPILIAFAFSFVHGAFTGHFWEALGLKPKQRKQA
ncbi:MAG: hypothetical protein OEZ39_19540 [Gammaproteobacteria bacterium]|nr:hypothetical protein [Gammaproteobacteria bacterium]MDH5654060.1 hypothetical protein [Gammaproteobacteria bacterium]